MDNITTELYKSDKEKVESFLSGAAEGERKTFDFQAFKRLVVSELAANRLFDENNYSFCGFRRCDIECMAECPERYGKKILKLSNYMYLKSGYYKRLIDYFANQATLNYNIDTKIYSENADMSKIKSSYFSFCGDSEKLNLRNEIHNILKRLYKNDVCFAYVVKTALGNTYFYIDPMYCGLSSIQAGGVFGFYINVNLVPQNKLAQFPQELIRAIKRDADKQTGRYYVPIEKSLCLKYNNDMLFPYPPFFMMIADILLIDEYKDLAKAQSINDAYKLLTMKIPTKDGEITLDDKLITAFTSIVLDTVQSNIGVITTPFETSSEEFSSGSSDDRDTVSDAISWAFKNVGVSESLMSGASSGSELKLSVTNDSGDIFRIYRMIEQQANLWLKLRKRDFGGFDFSYRILDMTIFNKQEVIDQEFKAAQSGLPNKIRLCSACGISPSATFGNDAIENNLFADMFDNWTPLKTSYTQTNDSADNSGGRPQESDANITEVTETQRDNDSNKPENRI